MTHIIFCFGRLNGNRFSIRSARDTAVIQKMVALKSKNPDLKVLLSLGGWGGCKTCSDVFATKQGREEFPRFCCTMEKGNEESHAQQTGWSKL